MWKLQLFRNHNGGPRKHCFCLHTQDHREKNLVVAHDEDKLWYGADDETKAQATRREAHWHVTRNRTGRSRGLNRKHVLF